jgi:type I restriction enzyme, S subunit
MAPRTSNVDMVEASSDPLLGCAERWPRVELGQIATIQSGFAFASRYFNKLDGAPLIRIRDVGKNTAETLYSGPIDDRYWVEDGDYLVGLDGEFRSARWEGRRALLNQRVAKITVDSEQYRQAFLELILPAYLRAINANTSSVTVKHLSTRTLATVPLPQPALSEQDQIVTFMRDVDQAAKVANDQLLAATRQLSAYSEALFKETYELRAGWDERPLGEIASVQSGITLGRRYAPDEELVERPYLRVANVQRGHLDLGDVRKIRVRKAEADRLTLVPGDVLMNEGGDRDKLGRGWVWEGQIPNCIHQNHVFRVRLNTDAISPLFLARFTNYVAHGYLEAAGTQTSNLASISARAVRSLPVPIPPKDEVVQIDDALSFAAAEIENFQREVAQARHLLDATRPMLLGQALAGIRSRVPDTPVLPIPRRVDAPRRRAINPKSLTPINTMQHTKRVSLLDVITKAPGPLSPEQLFTASNLDVEEVEVFYGQLSRLVDEGLIDEDRDKNLIKGPNWSKP